MSSTLAERVSLALAGPPRRTQKALADACGVKPPSVNGWVSGQSQSIEGANLVRAAAFLQVNPRWLSEGIGPMRGKDDGLSTLDIAHLSIHVAAGTGNVVEEVDRIGGLTFRRDFLRSVGIYTDSEDESIVLGVKGESMGPLFDGAVVLVNKKVREPRTGCIFVFVDGEGPLLKRVEKINGLWIARSDNDDKTKYPDFPFKKDNTLIGQAVWMGVKL